MKKLHAILVSLGASLLFVSASSGAALAQSTGDCMAWVTYSAGPISSKSSAGVYSGLSSGGPGPASAPSTEHDYLGEGGAMKTQAQCNVWARKAFKANAAWSSKKDTCLGTDGRTPLPNGDGVTVWAIDIWGTGAASYNRVDGYDETMTNTKKPVCKEDKVHPSFLTGTVPAL